LDQARNRIVPDAEQLASRAPEADWYGLLPLADYWRTAITYQLDDAHLAGLKRFYQFAADLDLIPSTSEPVFF